MVKTYCVITKKTLIKISQNLYNKKRYCKAFCFTRKRKKIKCISCQMLLLNLNGVE